MKFPTIKQISENAVTVEFGDDISRKTNELVLGFHYSLQNKNFPGFVESVPAYHSLTIYYDVASIARKFPYRSTTVSSLVTEQIKDLLPEPGKAEAGFVSEITIPVCYEKDCAPDMDFVSAHCGISKKEIVTLHTSVSYAVYFIGFIPGFPYLGINADPLDVPRKKVPALSVPAGSVAIAGKQSGIYPFAIPGGWQIIGRTALKLFDKAADPCCTLHPGQLIKFKAISYSEFRDLSAL